MVTVPRIAAVSDTDTIPFVYGIGHEGNLRAELLLTDPLDCIERFRTGAADFALVPSSAVPALTGAELLTDFCVASQGASGHALLLANSPVEELRRIVVQPAQQAEARLAAVVAAERWKIRPEWVLAPDGSEPEAAAEGDAYLVTTDDPAAYEGCFACSYDLCEEWYALTRLPFVHRVWVARKGTPYALTDALAEALTFGVEHLWEALAESGCADEAAYLRLTERVDYLFDEQKHRSLRKFWDSGVKVTPRVNPG